eukprot:c25612_g1_i1 orf=77-274(+)
MHAHLNKGVSIDQMLLNWLSMKYHAALDLNASIIPQNSKFLTWSSYLTLVVSADEMFRFYLIGCK